MVIDSHMHINSLVLDNINDEIKNVNDNTDLLNVINIGLNIDTSLESVLLANKNDKFFATVGVHPLYINNQNIEQLYDLSSDSKVVAIGEIGLDSLNNNLDVQKKYLKEQIEFANEVKLPIIIHSNNMNKEVIKIFEKDIKPKYGCVFHCFQPDVDDLNYLVKNDYYISFAGRITYKTARKSIEIIKKVPNDLFLVETDSPYISPEPYRDQINHSSNINLIVKKISDIKCVPYEKIEEDTINNTKMLFKKIGEI